MPWERRSSRSFPGPHRRGETVTTIYRNAIFAGGGSRCMWQLGFWDSANDGGLGLLDTVEYAASTSAGCAIATAALLDRGREALDAFKALTEANPSNIHWHNLRPWVDAPLLPHMGMYRRCLEELLGEEDLRALAGRTLEFLMARVPGPLPGPLAVLTAFSVYGLEKRVTGAIHPSWARRLGFRPLVASNHDAETPQDLVEMILAASCVPPVLPAPPFRGQRVLDGGMIDTVPAHLADGREGETLVLLSKRYRRPLPRRSGRVYVQPSEAIRIDKFDYADPEGLEATYQLGRRDGASFARQQRPG